MAIKEIKSFMTTDGSIFQNKSEAEAYECKEKNLKELANFLRGVDLVDPEDGDDYDLPVDIAKELAKALIDSKDRVIALLK